jgi:hypothetical protein
VLKRTRIVETSIKKAQPQDDFELVAEEHYVGLQLLVLAKKGGTLSNVQAVHSAVVGVGLLGVLGNKGAVGIRLQVHSSTFCFICAHMAAHRGYVSERNANYKSIATGLKFQKFGTQTAGVGKSPLHPVVRVLSCITASTCCGQRLPALALLSSAALSSALWSPAITIACHRCH